MKFQGGESAVQRLMQAYGFTMKKQLGDHLGAGTGTISTWVKRDYFPGEAIVRCSLETGADLEWLATGKGLPEFENNKEKKGQEGNITIPCQRLVGGVLVADGEWITNLSALQLAPEKPLLIRGDTNRWIVDLSIHQASEGMWFLKKGSEHTVANTVKLPKNTWLIDKIQWPEDELAFLGRVLAEITYK